MARLKRAINNRYEEYENKDIELKIKILEETLRDKIAYGLIAVLMFLSVINLLLHYGEGTFELWLIALILTSMSFIVNWILYLKT